MKFKAAIFDLDGTLADTIEDIADSMNYALAVKNFPLHDYGDYKYFVGRGMEELVLSSLPEEQRSEEIEQECLALLKEHYGRNYLNKTRLYPGIMEMLIGLSGMNLKLAVFSNKTEEFVIKIVEALLSSIRFEKVLGARPDMPKKPDSAGAIYLSNSLGVLPGNILYVGDTNTDMITANRSGMYALGALWGFRTKQELLESGAKELLSHPLDILDLVQ